MSEDSIIGTVVASQRGGDDKVGIVIESDNLERARRNERRKANSEGRYKNMVAVQWYKNADQRLNSLIEESKLDTTDIVRFIDEQYDKSNTGWHKTGALLVLKECSNE